MLIHGRSFKPPKAKLQKLWFDAIEAGLARDCSAAKVNAFRNVKKTFIYYGDISNRFLKKAHKKPPNFNTDDSAGRRITLNQLKQWKASQFTKSNYNKLPGKSSAAETIADLFGGIASFFRVGDPLIEAVAPDLREYWNFDSQFGSDVRAPLTKVLARALRANQNVLLIAHSLGTMISYDTLWKLSYYSEYEDIRNRKLNTFLTLGSPLADETVKRKLKGARADGARRYPSNIRTWVNVAAEDDYISHDEKVRDDYRTMRRLGLVDDIKDIRVYNLAVRDKKSNPHHSGGYLIHPKVTDVIANWL